MSLMDVLEAPVPVMLGLTKDQFVTMIDYKEIENRMWVLLDDDQIEVGNPMLDDGEEYFYEPYLDGLYQKLETLVNEITRIGGKNYLILLIDYTIDSDLNECEEKCY